MLSETDIHYLVGLLSLVSNPESVEIMLGDLVHDMSIDKDRDVDVTITYRNSNGLRSAFKGIEVKKHSRPLDVIHVEQLATKLNDIPDISQRAIVSASGYTKPAIKKAKAHGVDLFSLIPWENPKNGFEHVRFPPDFYIMLRTLVWADTKQITFNPTEHIADDVKKQIKGSLHIYTSNEQYSGCNTVQELTDKISIATLNILKEKEPIKSMAPEAIENVTCLLKNIDAFLEIKDDQLHLKEALIHGKVKWNEKKLHPEFKVLVKEGDTKPYVGCAIAEHPDGNLMGVTVSQFDRSLKFINVTISNRNKKKIRLHKLR